VLGAAAAAAAAVPSLIVAAVDAVETCWSFPSPLKYASISPSI
jgi:hypothetical protein